MNDFLTAFKEVAVLQRGFDLPIQVREDGQVPVVASNGIVGWHSRTKVSAPGVVTGRSGTIGKVMVLQTDFWPLNTTLYVKDFKGNMPGFIALLLETMDLPAHAGGSTVPSLNRNVLDEVVVYCPPLPVQRRIVDLMAHLDNQIARLRLEQDAVAHVVTAARLTLTAQWPMVPLESLCDVVAPLVDPRSDEFADLLHIGIERMEKGGGQLLPLESARIEGLISSKYLFGERDVVFSKIRPNLKKVVVPGFVGLCSADAYPLTPVEGVPGALLREVLLLPTVTEQIVGKSSRTKMPKVNRRELMTVTVPMSSSHRERDEAVAVLNGLRLTSMALESESSRLRDSRTALLGALLSQEVELPSSYDSLLSGVS